MNFVNKGLEKMAKSARKKTKARVSLKKKRKRAKIETRTAEHVGCLLELHKLQGVLLAELDKEV